MYEVFSTDNNMHRICEMDESNPGGWACGWAKSNHAMAFVTNHDRMISDEDRPRTITLFNEGRYKLALMTLLAHPYGG